MLADERREELVRFERTFNLVRLGGAGLAFFLGPLFPNLGAWSLLLLGVGLLIEAGTIEASLRRVRTTDGAERLSRSVYVVDLVVVSFAIFAFAADPRWTTYIVMPLLIIAGGFRFGRRGGLAGAAGMSLAYVAIAFFRADVYAYPLEPERILFTVTVNFLAAFLMAGLVRELRGLRGQREAFLRQAAETEALRAVDQMKSDFLAAMSHDFRSPLTVVRGAVELLLGERPGSLTPGQRELAESAERNVLRLEEFTEELLEMARLEQGAVALDQEDLDVRTLLSEVVADHQILAKQRKQWFALDAPAAAMTVSADRGRLRRALSNLVGNAIKYGPTGTPITVRAERQNGQFRIAVSDHGPGVPPDERGHMFEKFFRGRGVGATPGAGLGLAIARSLVVLHGGTLDYEDTPGGGSTFVVRLPAESQ
ncbi:MAG: HAMP domain-containing sensor histidine kinase [Chloroflexota bacterium]